ncbi:FMN-dependent NADH-azoreductase [Chitinophaga sp. GCM10012297]|uniref:FMN dependent NADH:quinone oxidoreductase n=1 Tax=Chitinophaga chungangae TaxID=2821488 RepID=A0ABS3YKH4_9BACT|nr:NAD(P)H-dependent oxidoreductase [Chitinophaga chungangae]MBO9155187.1 NAD(P)H-dependent oxidoreductase [Chitinophaga chungangae]
MKKVLVINTSARTAGSKSRKLTEMFTESWERTHDRPEIRFRELGTGDVPHISGEWLTAAFKPAAARSEEENGLLARSDIYISELREADVIVLGAPMYNWSVPSTLKAWLDHVMRINETFRADPARAPHPYIGLLKNKTLILLLTRGNDGYEKGEHSEHMNFQSTYLETVFNIMGITDIHTIAVNGASLGAEMLESSIDRARQAINRLVKGELIL